MAKIPTVHTEMVGEVKTWASSQTPPASFLFCDGSAISRTAYPALFAIIGTSHGAGDGSTTFNLPDYRGRFLRGVDGTAGNDPDKAGRTALNSGGNTGNAVGSLQGHSMQDHKHGQTANLSNNEAASGAPNGSGPASSASANLGAGAATARQLYTSTMKTDGVTTPQTSTETRPINVAVNYIIRVK